jgi:hypothetical protein
MKTIYISSLALLMLSMSTPCVTEAYFTTNQTATKINDMTALYSIEYAFGLEKRDIYMPVYAERGLLHASSAQKVGYSLREDGKEVTLQGTTIGMAVSKAPIVNGMYKLEKGKAQKMTLYVILTTSSTTLEMDYALQVDKLPFYVDIGKKDLQTQGLNPSELQYYVTKQVELNSKPKVKNSISK